MILVASSHTQRGIERRQQQAQIAAPSQPSKPPSASVALPELCSIIPFRTPKDELRQIIDLVARMHGSTYRAVMSHARRNNAAVARFAAVCAVKQTRPCMSLTQMAMLFGKKDHSPISHAMKMRGFK